MHPYSCQVSKSLPDVNVYGFAYYIWQQLNRWQADGSTDYGQQIFRFQSYVTPSCRAQLQADMQNRHSAGELRGRTRQMTEIPGLGYAANRVIADGTASWTVLLDMQLMETFRGQSVKDAFIRYTDDKDKNKDGPKRDPGSSNDSSSSSRSRQHQAEQSDREQHGDKDRSKQSGSHPSGGSQGKQSGRQSG